MNTDSNVIMLFLSRLTSMLSQQDVDWRSKTVFLLDGASYHKSKETRKTFDSLGIRVVISAPYSYAAAPVEKFFGYFKSTNINPKNLKLGKK